MTLPTISPAAYRRVTAVALWLLVFIVVTGAGVRLSESGLGCSDWPRCEEDELVAELSFHPMVEFVNRTITGLVSAAVIVAVAGSLRRAPRRTDLVWLSLGLVGGVVAQIVLGGLVVLSHLDPKLVQGHFLLSMVLVANAAVLHRRAGRPDGPVRPVVVPELRTLAIGLVVAGALTITTGTVVTGTGPHPGSHEGDLIERLPYEVGTVARIHGAAMVLFLLGVVAFAWMAHRTRAPRSVVRATEVLLVTLVLQAAVGYTQYFTGVPVALVAIHILGATLVWLGVVRLVLGLSEAVADGQESTHAADHGASGDGAARDPVASR